jgi:hypothetical protein
MDDIQKNVAREEEDRRRNERDRAVEVGRVMRTR